MRQRPVNSSRRNLLRAGLVSVVAPVLAALDPSFAGLLRAANASTDAITRFSTLPEGSLAASTGWQHQPVKNVAPNSGQVVGSPGQRYLLIKSSRSGSAWGHKVAGALANKSRLNWQWFIRGTPGQSELGNKATDDFAARVFVLFDYPLSKVPFGRRLAIRLARLIYDNVPAAAICYVWIPGGKSDQMQASPYTSRLQMFVANVAPADGRWHKQERDIAADFQRAFGAEFGAGMAPIDALVLSSDTDQTGGRVDAGFSDITLGS